LNFHWPDRNTPAKHKEIQMALLERIKSLVFGKDVPSPMPADGDTDSLASTPYQYEKASKPSVSTPADDPVMDEVAASGLQPVSKPWEIEEAQNPRRTPSPPGN
jgi:hypothetical protein